jgi:ABC-type transporter Mla MlaB component
MDFKYRVEKKDGWDNVYMSGKINEDSESQLIDMGKHLASKVVINFAGIKMVNSCGVRAWISFIREAQKSREIVFEECTPEIVSQVNMIPNFLGLAKIRSVYAEYGCEHCGHSAWRMFESGKDLPDPSHSISLSDFNCEVCGKKMEMEEIEDEFFGFLQAS